MTDDAAARLFEAFVSHDPAEAISVIEGVRSAGVEHGALFDTVFAPAMAMLGGAWASGAIDEYAFTQASVVAEQAASFVTPSVTARDTGVTVLIGGMHRDLHAMDKDIIAAALKEAGYRVVDLGVDVRPAQLLERAEETGARVVIVSAQMTATAHSVSRIREMFSAGGRDDLVLFVSGGPFVADPQLARDVGANGVVKGAESAVRVLGKAVRDHLSVGDAP